MKSNTDVLIVGGGLAGLTSAIHLSKMGLDVTLIEKGGYPRHKVCGEFISNEVLPYLEWLDADPSVLKPSRINRFTLSDVSGNMVESKLPLGGFGISRYAFDHFLFEKVRENSCEIIEDSVSDISFSNDLFNVSTTMYGNIKAKIVIGAYGKRSNLDHKFSRKFISQKSPWLGVKAHYTGELADDVVELHNFKGGYCGVSKVENNIINICYLADYDSFKKYKNTEEFEKNVIYKNKRLEAILSTSKMIFEKPVTIGQISFENKKTIEDHVLMAGDTAGLIHPLCGSGMAIAIHSAKICSELIVDYFSGKITTRKMMEDKYMSLWNAAFYSRLRTGRWLGALFRKDRVSEMMVSTLIRLPVLLPVIIKQVHGKPITMSA